MLLFLIVTFPSTAAMFTLVPALVLAASTVASSSAGGTFLTTFAALDEEKSSEQLSWSFTRSEQTRDATPGFKLGSGAVNDERRKLFQEEKTADDERRMQPSPSRVLSETESSTEGTSPTNKKPAILKLTPFLALMSVLMLMMPSPGGRDSSNYRVPPAWNPENEQHYSFRAYMTDMSIWIMLTDLQPHQQCAAIIMRLGGAAREMARMLTPVEMMHGGQINGQAVGPVAYLLGNLHLRFSALEDESRLTSMTELLAFARKPGETINSLLARYETIRHRSALEGQFMMSYEGYSLQLIRACGISTQHMLTLLQPFGQRFPQDEQQFLQLQTQLRRFGHISENSPGNIASIMQGPPRQARPGSYHVEHGTPFDAVPTYFGATDAGGGRTSNSGTQGAAVTETNDPFAMWSSPNPAPVPPPPVAMSQEGGCRTAETYWQSAMDDEIDSDTDSMTSSDDFGETTVGGPDISQMGEAEAAESLFFQYRKAKRAWRRFTGKPVRRFRRTFNRSLKKGGKGYGKGSYGKGKRRSFLYTKDDVQAFLSGKGKGHRSHTSGKGHGRRKNPRDRNGNTLTCRICGSEEHFQAECPQNSSKGGSKGAPPSAGGTATFLTSFAAQPEALEADSGGGRTSNSTAVAPPWADEGDLMFEPPRECFPIFPAPGSTHPESQFEIGEEGDPWAAAYAQSIATSIPGVIPANTTASVGAWNRSNPSHFREFQEYLHEGTRAPGGSVSADDELSDSSVAPERSIARSKAPPHKAPPPLPPPPNYVPRVPPIPVPPIGHSHAPQPKAFGPNPWQDYRDVTGDPLRHVPRQRNPSAAEAQVLSILEGQELVRNFRQGRSEERNRRERENPTLSEIHQTHGLQGGLPISVAHSPSAQLPQAGVPKAPAFPNSMDMIQAAVDMSATMRGATITDGQAVYPPAPVVPQQPSASGGERTFNATVPMDIEARTAAAAAVPVPHAPELVPLIYDGAEESCSICAEAFRGGERVCRLRCRHMFHADCWQQYVSVNQLREEFSNCPNCRGSGTLIAIWNYLDQGNDTQEVSGNVAENHLEAQAMRHSIATPSEGTPRQNEPNTSADTSGGRTFNAGAAAASSSYIIQSSVETSVNGPPSYHIRTRLADGRPSITIDPGSVGNLCGDKWAKEVARAAAQNNQKPTYEKRQRPLTVSGVGHGSQECHYDCKLPVALQQTEGRGSVLGSMTVPAVANSDLPGLLGLNALRKNRAIIDFSTLRLHFCGPAGVDLERHLPPGSESFQTELAPSGHMVLPCCEFQRGSTDADHTLTLLSQNSSGGGRTSNTTEPKEIKVATMIPPPPPRPPVLPMEVRLSSELPVPPKADS